MVTSIWRIKKGGENVDETLPAAPASVLGYQGVGIRFVATLIDVIIAGILAAFVVLPMQTPGQISVMNVTNTATVPTVSVSPNPLAGLAGTISVLIFFVYYFVLEGAYGQTVGKMAVKIKVLRDDGSKISYADAAARNILRPIDLIPFIVPYLLGAILMWSSDTKQRLGDRVAHTVVVKA
jgi:uncharacterized RDD family membrane protein YckC